MNFAAKVPYTRRSKYKEYQAVNAASPSEAPKPKSSPAPSPFLNRRAAPAFPTGAGLRRPPSASASSIEGRATPSRLNRLNRPKSIEQISQALGEPRDDDEEQVVVMVMARATEDGNFRITMPDSSSDDPGTDVGDMSTTRPYRPQQARHNTSYGREPSTTSSMPDEFFLPMGGPQFDSSNNNPQFFRYPANSPTSPGPGYPNTGYFPTIDEVDHAPPELHYSCWDIFINLVSVGTYIADVGSDLFVAYLHFRSGNWWWFALTLAFVLVPSLVVTCFSLAWYCQDHVADKAHNRPTASNAKWVSRFLFHLLQLGPVLRYIDTIIYGCRSKFKDHQTEHVQKKQWYDMMLFEDTDSCLLRLIECFMEAAPQLVLQLYIMSSFGAEENTILLIGQSLGCATSLCSLAWSLVSYHRSLRLSLDDKANISNLGMTLQFFWHMFIIAARVVALAMFAAQFHFWVSVLIGAHYIVMLIWIMWQSTDFCRGHKCQEFFFNMVIAAVYIFSYLNLQDGHTRLRYIFYYVLVYFENSIMILMMYLFSHTETVWYVPLSIVVVMLGFIIGVILQIIYYMYAHPNNFPPVQPWYPHKRIRLCLTCNELMNRPRVNFSQVELRDVHRVLN